MTKVLIYIALFSFVFYSGRDFGNMKSTNRIDQLSCFNKRIRKNIRKEIINNERWKAYNNQFKLKQEIVANDSNCIGLYFLMLDSKITNWYIYIPLLSFSHDDYLINDSYIEGKFVGIDSIDFEKKINDKLIRLKDEFEEDTLKTLISKFKYGSYTMPKHRINLK